MRALLPLLVLAIVTACTTTPASDPLGKVGEPCTPSHRCEDGLSCLESASGAFSCKESGGTATGADTTTTGETTGAGEDTTSTGTGTGTGSDTTAGSDTETGSDTGDGTGSDAGTGADTGSDSGTGADTGSGSDSGTGTDTGAGSATGDDSGTDSGSGAGSDTGTGGDSGTDSGSGTGGDTGAATEGDPPSAQLTPAAVEFGSVPAGTNSHQPVVITNVGGEDLHVEGIGFTGHPDFELTVAGTTYNSGDPILFVTPLIIPPGDALVLDLAFAPLTFVSAQATLVFLTNDPEFSDGLTLNAQANTLGPCIFVSPLNLAFGATLFGAQATESVTIESCGTQSVVVSAIKLTGDTHPDFSLSYTNLPGGQAPSLAAPLVLGPGDIATFTASYTPIAASLQLSGGTILIVSDALESEVPVNLSGLGTDTVCPTAVGIVVEGDEVIPQTNLHLLGNDSSAPAGDVSSWAWSVTQPSGSASVFVPSKTSPNPTFETNVAGAYVFELEVWDDVGVKSCVPWSTTVLVVPDEAIHVELLWHTPEPHP